MEGMASKQRILIVGAGLTGSLTAYQLHGKYADSVALTVLEKSRGAGGRMATNRFQRESNLSCDHGAQYLSITTDYQAKHSRYHNELLSSGVIKPYTGLVTGENPYDLPGVKNYMAPSGISSVVKHFLQSSGADAKFGETCESVSLSNDKKKWKVQSNGRTHEHLVDSLILTMPVPQILKLKGDISELLDPFKANLNLVEYSSRYSLVLYFDKELDLGIPWVAKYFKDESIAYISFDSQKREQDTSHGTSIIVHTNVPFGLKYLEQDFKIVEPLIRDSVQRLIPNLPEPVATKCHRWRYSQVYKGYPGSPGCLVVHERPLLILGGDAFLKSNFDNCIDCSEAVLKAVMANFPTSKC